MNDAPFSSDGSWLLHAALAAVVLIGLWVAWGPKAGVRSALRRLFARARLELFKLFLSCGAAVRDFRSACTRLATSRMELVVLALVTLVAVWVRLEHLHQPMRYDEACTYMYSVRPGVLHGLLNYHGPNNHVFHSLLVMFSTGLFGSAPWAIRLVALVAGVLIVPVVVLCARLGIREDGGLIAAGLVAVSPYQVLYSTNGRGYSLVALGILLAVPVARYMIEKRSSAACLLLAVMCSLLLLTIPTAGLGLVGIGIWMIWISWATRHTGGNRQRRRLILGWVVATGLLTAALYAPVVWRSGLRRLVSNEFVSPIPLKEFPGRFRMRAGLTVAWFFRDTGWHTWFLVCVACAAGLVALWRRNRPAFQFFVSLLVGAAAVVLLRRIAPPVRAWSFALPLVFLLCDTGITRVVIRLSRSRMVVRLGLAAVLAVVILPGTWRLLTQDIIERYPDTGLFPEAEQAAVFLIPRLRAGDHLVAPSPATWPVRYYLYRHDVPWERYLVYGEPRRYYIVYSTRTVRDVSQVLGQYQMPKDTPKLVKSFPQARVYRLGE